MRWKRLSNMQDWMLITATRLLTNFRDFIFWIRCNFFLKKQIMKWNYCWNIWIIFACRKTVFTVHKCFYVVPTRTWFYLIRYIKLRIRFICMFAMNNIPHRFSMDPALVYFFLWQRAAKWLKLYWKLRLTPTGNPQVLDH